MLVRAALASQPTSWNAVLGAASLVLMTAGVVALVRRSMSLRQAASVVAVAAGVGVVAAFASRFPSGLYAFVVIASTTLAGIAMAVAIVSRR